MKGMAFLGGLALTNVVRLIPGPGSAENGRDGSLPQLFSAAGAHCAPDSRRFLCDGTKSHALSLGSAGGTEGRGCVPGSLVLKGEFPLRFIPRFGCSVLSKRVPAFGIGNMLAASGRKKLPSDFFAAFH